MARTPSTPPAATLAPALCTMRNTSLQSTTLTGEVISGFRPLCASSLAWHHTSTRCDERSDASVFPSNIAATRARARPDGAGHIDRRLRASLTSLSAQQYPAHPLGETIRCPQHHGAAPCARATQVRRVGRCSDESASCPWASRSAGAPQGQRQVHLRTGVGSLSVYPAVKLACTKVVHRDQRPRSGQRRTRCTGSGAARTRGAGTTAEAVSPSCSSPRPTARSAL